MALFLERQWLQLANDWGLDYHKAKPWQMGSASVTGIRRGHPIKLWWRIGQTTQLTILVRFPRVQDPDSLREAFSQEQSLGERRSQIVVRKPGQAWPAGESPPLVLYNNSLVWHQFYWSSPKAEQLKEYIDAILLAVSHVAPAFDGRCETCGADVGSNYVIVDGLPVVMCSSCRQAVAAKGEVAERAYDDSDARHLNGLLLGAIAAILCAGVWAFVAALSDRFFFFGAIVIGIAVGFAYRRGAGRVDRMGRLIAAALCLASVALGQILYCASVVAKRYPEVGFKLDDGWRVYLANWKEDPLGEALPVLIGLLGAWYAARVLERPRLHSVIEDPVDPSDGTTPKS